MRKSSRSLFSLFAASLMCLFQAADTGHASSLIKATYVDSAGKELQAEFDTIADKVKITMPGGQTVSLNSTIAASGAKYSDGKTTFWEHQGSASVFAGETLVFEGKDKNQSESEEEVVDDGQFNENDDSGPSVPPVSDITPFRGPVEQYSASLKKSDKDFGNPGPTDPFECTLDAGEGKQPLNALCQVAINEVYVSGEWASVEFALAPLDQKYKGMPIMADGALYFLLKRDGKSWKGMSWFLGSDQPNMSSEKIREIGIAEKDLNALGWMETPPEEEAE